MMRTKRIGVDYAGPIWSIKPYRFVSIAAPKGPLHDHQDARAKLDAHTYKSAARSKIRILCGTD